MRQLDGVTGCVQAVKDLNCVAKPEQLTHRGCFDPQTTQTVDMAGNSQGPTCHRSTAVLTGLWVWPQPAAAAQLPGTSA